MRFGYIYLISIEKDLLSTEKGGNKDLQSWFREHKGNFIILIDRFSSNIKLKILKTIKNNKINFNFYQKYVFKEDIPSLYPNNVLRLSDIPLNLLVHILKKRREIKLELRLFYLLVSNPNPSTCPLWIIIEFKQFPPGGISMAPEGTLLNSGNRALYKLQPKTLDDCQKIAVQKWNKINLHILKIKV